jgi:N-methylhydantoinase A
VDETGLLRLGPGSAGASPGPACYGRGGTLPTLSDANALLGYYPDRLLGGQMALDIDAARTAVRTHLSQELDMSDEEIALGMLRIANADMEGAIRIVSTQRGVDLRQSTLIPFGGAGPVHACMLAQQLGIPRVLVPPAPGNVNAFGALVADSRYDYSAMFARDLDAVEITELEASLKALTDEARKSLSDHADTALDELTFAHFVDARYKGQGYELTFPLSWQDGLPGPDWRPDIEASFHQAHRAAFTFDSPGSQVELVSVRLVVSRPGIEFLMREHRADARTDENQRVSTRLAWFPGMAERQPVAVYQRALLPQGGTWAGPAIVEEYSSTAVIPPGASFSVDRQGNLDILVGGTTVD